MELLSANKVPEDRHIPDNEKDKLFFEIDNNYCQ